MHTDDPAQLLKALKDLSAMYTHAWDVEGGDLHMSGESTKLFESRHAAATKAIEHFEALQKTPSTVTLTEAEINLKHWEKAVAKLRDQHCKRFGHIKGHGAFTGYSYCKTCGGQVANTDFGQKAKQ